MPEDKEKQEYKDALQSIVNLARIDDRVKGTFAWDIAKTALEAWE